MGALTGVLYGFLLVFLGGWATGKWTGNFSFLLFVLTVVTLAYWLAERFKFAPARAAAAARLEALDAERRSNLAQQGIQRVDGDISKERDALLAQPWWLDWTAGLFPVILVVFLLRSFLFEPFKIPSASMVPTLLIGDLILVNKYHYGVRLPVVNKKVVALNDPQRGDVMVFRYPVNPAVDYIKRVVGVPGDEVAYLNQHVYLNGTKVTTQPLPDFFDDEVSADGGRSGLRYMPQFEESFGDHEHRILVDVRRPSYVVPHPSFPYKENCRYSAEGVTCKVPAGHYFVMGDNRDNSEDSRYWGFVPDQNIVGKAFFVWMHFGNFGRIGSFD